MIPPWVLAIATKSSILQAHMFLLCLITISMRDIQRLCLEKEVSLDER